MALEIEDDVFFADISRQIALLIMDDDDDGFPASRHRPAVLAQELPYFPQTIMPPTYGYQARYQRECKGTGVFIPKSTIPRRQNKNNKANAINSKSSSKNLDRSSVMVSSVKDISNNRVYSNY